MVYRIKRFFFNIFFVFYIYKIDKSEILALRKRHRSEAIF